MLSEAGKVFRMERKSRPKRQLLVYQFLIVLARTDPLIWRRIQVPKRYSFWDLHVAIQDAMGWQDCHLHQFTLVDPRNGQLERVGIPDEDMPDAWPCRAGWEVRMSPFFGYEALPVRYLYDFGDNWEHVLVYEGTWPAEESVKYPLCLSGARACPPEDCGSIMGYANFLEAVRNVRHPEHKEMLEWVGGNYDPDGFFPGQVSFDDPRKRWKEAFQED